MGVVEGAEDGRTVGGDDGDVDTLGEEVNVLGGTVGDELVGRADGRAGCWRKPCTAPPLRTA